MLSHTLAQSTQSVSSVLFWVLVLIVGILVGGVVIFAVRKRMLGHAESANRQSSGLLDHLREMHRSGEIDDAEYEQARKVILQKVQENMAQWKAEREAKNDGARGGRSTQDAELRNLLKNERMDDPGTTHSDGLSS